MKGFEERVIQARRVEYGDRIKILEMLRAKNRFSDIARRYNVSRERVRQIYFQYFADIIPIKELKEYHRETHKTKRNQFLDSKRKELMEGTNTPLLKLAKRVEESGLTFGLIEAGGNGYKVKTVLINGKRTRFLVGNTIRRKKYVYNRVTIARKSLDKVEYVVTYMPNTDKFYIYPSARIIEFYASEGKSVLCWYPDSGNVGAGYIENWDLFKR